MTFSPASWPVTAAAGLAAEQMPGLPFASIEDQIRVDSQIDVKRLPNANYSGAARNDLLLLEQFALARYLGANITSHFEYGIIVVFNNLRLAKADVTGCNEAQQPSSNPVSKACSCNAMSAE